jgi:hypothetical protein
MSAGSVQVCGRSVYGQIKIYPVSDSAKVLSELVGKATLTQLDLARAEALGLKVEFVADPKLAAAVARAA